MSRDIRASAMERRVNNYHKNARTTVFSRELAIRRVGREGLKAPEVARQPGMSRRTVHKWLARYRAGSVGALHDQSRRPRHSPGRTPVEKVAAIAAMRRMRMTGPSMAFTRSLPLSTVGLELRRLGLNRWSRLETKPPVMRYQHKKPGDMTHLDIKKLGKIDGVDHRITGDRIAP